VIFSKTDIDVKSWLVREVVNLVLSESGLSVDRVFLVGSYASGRATDKSDIDFLVQLKGGKRPMTYPTWRQMGEINKKLNNKRIHVIYGSLDAQQSLWQKDPVKYSFREVKINQGVQNDGTHQSCN